MAVLFTKAAREPQGGPLNLSNKTSSSRDPTSTKIHSLRSLEQSTNVLVNQGDSNSYLTEHSPLPWADKMCHKQREKLVCQARDCANPEYIPDPAQYKISPSSSPDCHGVCTNYNEMRILPTYWVIPYTCDACRLLEQQAKEARDRDKKWRDDNEDNSKGPPGMAHASKLPPWIKGRA